MIRRREFLAGAASLALVPDAAWTQESPARRKRIAFIGTEVRNLSHAQHFLDRLAIGYGWRGGWQEPRLDIASVYIDQFPENDLGRVRVAKYGLKLVPSIADALTLGTGSLAVDGVVVIGEHGKYPRNEKKQVLYPRYEWFKECVRIFESNGRAVPVFNDKHLSTTWERCAEMVADSKRLNFPFLAGSSLPVTRRLPAVDIPHGAPLRESVSVGYGGLDGYDIHALETAQCMSERRKGGETGVKRVHVLKGASMWDVMSRPDREETRRLLVAALTRSHTLPVDGGYPSDRVSFEWARRVFPDGTAYAIEHLDGFRTTMFLLAIQDFNYAGLRSDTGEIISCQMFLPMPLHGATTADFFHPLVRHIEDLVLTGKTPYPVERTLLTSGMVVAAVDSVHRGNVAVETPELKVRYEVGPESTFWRD